MNESIEAWKRAWKLFEEIDQKTREVEQESWMLTKIIQNDELDVRGKVPMNAMRHLRATELKRFSMKNKRSKSSWKKPNSVDKK